MNFEETPKKDTHKLKRAAVALAFFGVPGVVAYGAGVVSGTGEAHDRALQNATAARQAHDMEAAKQFEENAVAASQARVDLLSEPATAISNTAEAIGGASVAALSGTTEIVSDHVSEYGPQAAFVGIIAVGTVGMGYLRRRPNDEQATAFAASVPQSSHSI